MADNQYSNRTYPTGFMVTGKRCKRKAWKDGLCKQHHPGTIKARDAVRDAKWAVERAESLRIHSLAVARSDVARLALKWFRSDMHSVNCQSYADLLEALHKLDQLENKETDGKSTKSY